ncbi:MAG: Dam family site-specific DNA-(adenine-N6)-methyltransferase [Bacteroidales bacterium]|jgi:DNA adenine methylase|nr:Dam family site-specific DNA-(adenine-N6)-methyltransferase [Bacteroidales bacterium]
MITTKRRNKQQVKSPLNYIGGKSKLLPQLLPLFPKDIDNFIDLFCGGCNVGINVDANKIYFNDNLTYLIEMYKVFQKKLLDETIWHIEKRINEFELSLTNELGYKKLRETYNQEKNPLDLFVLIAYSFNHQIRFNNNHEYNNPFGRERSCFNPAMKENLVNFIVEFKESDIEFSNTDFEDYEIADCGENDFVYCDPPYLITTGTYNDGKRGFKGWTEREERQLLKKLDEIDEKRMKFALSNVVEHKGKENIILKKWVENNSNYRINYLNYNYYNSNYHTIIRDKNASVEVLITNYEPPKQPKNIFSF